MNHNAHSTQTPTLTMANALSAIARWFRVAGKMDRVRARHHYHRNLPHYVLRAMGVPVEQHERPKWH